MTRSLSRLRAPSCNGRSDVQKGHACEQGSTADYDFLLSHGGGRPVELLSYGISLRLERVVGYWTLGLETYDFGPMRGSRLA